MLLLAAAVCVVCGCLFFGLVLVFGLCLGFVVVVVVECGFCDVRC